MDWSGYPPGSRRAVIGAAVSSLPGALVLVILPVGAVLISPGSGWPVPVIIVLDVLLLALIIGCTVALLDDARRLFGLRLVPRFERPLVAPHNSFFGGYELARRFGDLERFASARGVAPLSAWLDPAAFSDCATARQLLLLMRGEFEGRELATELAMLDDALGKGAAQGLRFRLQLVTGTAMNAMLMEELHKRGY